MAQVRWTFQALDDLEAICLFIARDAPHVATVFADRAFRATDRLVQHPRLGRMVPEKVREILKLLNEDGWDLATTEGSHRQFKHLVS